MRSTASGLVILGVLLCSGCSSTTPDRTETPSSPPLATSAPPAAVPEVVAVDSGPVDSAAGAATLVSEGVYYYVVASDDVPQAIGARFGVCTMDVLISNPPQDPWLIPGQTIVVSRVTLMPLDSTECRMDVDQGPWR